jgi:hypothetical protein
MTRTSLLETAHDIVLRHLRPGGIAVDATLGNGHDTVFLAQCVGDVGHVFGFDIQARALDNTRQRLQQQVLETRATLFHVSHAEMLTYIPAKLHGGIQVVMFNLGYLPGGDKNVITRTSSTLDALDAALGLLEEQGVITVLAYPGHTGGDRETEQLVDWCGSLDSRQVAVEIILSSHAKPNSPRLFVIRKQADLL